MKKLFILTLFLSFSALQAETRNLTQIDIYNPVGYETDDNAQVALESFLPNLCYQYPKATKKIEGKNIYLNLTAKYERRVVFLSEANVSVEIASLLLFSPLMKILY